LRLNEKLVAKRIKRSNHGFVRWFRQIFQRVAGRISDRAFGERLPFGVYNTAQLTFHVFPAIRLPVQIEDKDSTNARAR